MNESRPGRPSTSGTEEHIRRVDKSIREDRRITLAVQVATIAGISYEPTQAILG